MRESIGADAALQAHDVKPRDVAEPGTVEADHVAEVRRIRRICMKGSEVIVGRDGMNGGALVPVAPVGDEVLVVHGSVLRRTRRWLATRIAVSACSARTLLRDIAAGDGLRLQSAMPSISTAFVPPNANEFDSITRALTPSRGAFGT